MSKFVPVDRANLPAQLDAIRHLHGVEARHVERVASGLIVTRDAVRRLIQKSARRSKNRGRRAPPGHI